MPPQHTPHTFQPMGSGTWCNFCGHSKAVCEYRYNNRPTTNESKDTMTTTSIPFTMTNESITVVTKAGPKTIHRTSPQYLGLRGALFNEQWDRIESFLTVRKALGEWFKGTAFTLDASGTITFDGAKVPDSITSRMATMAANGEDPTPLVRFYERLIKNPSYRSVTQLHHFMAHVGIPIEPDGTFLAYKGLRDDLTDVHSGKFSNVPGAAHAMPRNQVSDDADVPCHKGFHVGALEYASGFGSRVVICRVNPEHVVSVPSDYSCQKMRVCEYTVVGFWNGETMPSTTFASDVGAGEEYEDEDEVDDDSDSNNQHAFDHRADKPAKVKKPIKVVTAKGNKMARMKPDKLMECGIDELRQYATHTVKIVGASKMAGGKSALVSAILKARRKVKKPAKSKK